MAIGLSSSIVAFLIMNGFQNNVKHKIYSFSSHLILTKFVMNNSPEEQPLNFRSDIYTNPDDYPFIRHAEEYAHKPGLVKTEDEVIGVVVRGVGKSFDEKAFRENMVEGRFIEFNDSTYSKEVVLSSRIAAKLKAKVGDDLVLHFFQNPPRFRKLKVTGIYETNLTEYFDDKIILADIRMIQQLNNWGDSLAGGVKVLVNTNFYDPAELRQEHLEFVMSEETSKNPLVRATTWLGALWSFDFERAALEKARQQIGMINDYDQDITIVHEQYNQIFEWLGLISRQVNLLLVIILIVICVNMISIILILVMERTQMIGMFKALGANDKMIRSIFLYQGLNLVLKGMAIGNVLGIGLCFLQDKFKILKLNPKDYYISYVPVSWNWEIIIVLNVLMLVVVTLVLLIPTMVISRISPIRAIRFD